MRKRNIALVGLLASLFATGGTAAPADLYWQWCVSHFGHHDASSPALKDSLWGENADPDHDGIVNLIEYTADTDPKLRTSLSECYTFQASQNAQLLAWIRTDDPDLRVVCQTSSDMKSWLPDAPFEFENPPIPNPFVYDFPTGVALPGLRQIAYMDPLSVEDRPAAFMRLLVKRGDASVTSPGIEPFSFAAQQEVLAGGIARSNSIVLGGFTGSLSLNIPTGVTLFVNDVAQTGETTLVKAGDVLWMEAAASDRDGVIHAHSLSVGGHSATWIFTSASIGSIPDHPGEESGYTQVHTGISDLGAAQASIPIIVPPGTAGMQPEVSIAYSSQSGNGPLGIGFRLDGISSISRVGATIVHDGFKGSVRFDDRDRFAFDGQRLLAISGVDGGDQTEYRLEFDPTVRIRSFGSINGGPERWVVETKSGLTMDFGLTVQSRVSTIGKSAILVWVLERITDSSGNGIRFSYDPDGAARGETLVTLIQYTENASAGLSPHHEVRFDYENRPDVRNRFIAGGEIQMLKRLRTIRSLSTIEGEQELRRYELSYHESLMSGASLLDKVTDVARGTFSSDTDIGWHDATLDQYWGLYDDGFWNGTHGAPELNLSYVRVGDFDGDGKSDLFSRGSDGLLSVFLRQVSRQGTANPSFSLVQSDATEGFNQSQTWLGDFNADGLTDVLTRLTGSKTFRTYYSVGDGTFTGASYSQDLAWNEGDQVTGDFNGDGRTDILAGIGGSSASPREWRCFLSNGDGTFESVVENNWWNWNGGTTLLTGDFNGDGLTDLVSHNAGPAGFRKWVMMLSDGDGTFTQKEVLYESRLGHGDGEVRPKVGDFNGDGISDLIGKAGSDVLVFLFDGADGVQVVRSNVEVSNYDWNRGQVGNLDCDSMTDLVSQIGGSQTIRIRARGNGVMEAQVESVFPPSFTWNPSYFWVGDFDGDGKADITSYSAVSQHAYGFLHLSSHGSGGPIPNDLLKEVTNRHGQFAGFGYAALTRAYDYSKGTGSVYPCLDFQGSLFVATSIRKRNGVDGHALLGGGATGISSLRYRYEGARSCLDGRGFLGFRAIEITDFSAETITRTEYEYSDPLLAGQPRYFEKRLQSPTSAASDLINSKEITWNRPEPTIHATGHKTYFLSEQSNVSKSYEVNRPAATALVGTITRNGMQYDELGNLLQVTTTTVGSGEAFTETVASSYDDTVSPTTWFLGRLATTTVTKAGPDSQALTRQTEFRYDQETGLLIEETIEPEAGNLTLMKSYTHDAFGNVISSTIRVNNEPPRVTTTTYTEPAKRFVATTTNSAGHVESKTYDPLYGNVLTKTGPNNLTTAWEYDSLGRPIKEVRADRTETRTAYRLVTEQTKDAPYRAAHYVRTQSSGSAPKTVWFDVLDRIIRTDSIAYDGRTVSSLRIFDQKGQLSSESLPFFEGVWPTLAELEYDEVGREIQRTDPGSRITTTVYDGFTTSVTNPESQTVSSVVNAMGWTVESRGAEGNALFKRHDAYGNLRFVEDPDGNVSEIRYDLRSNKVWMSEPNSGVTTYTYNGFGELLSQTNSAGETVRFTYDSLGRVIRRVEPEGETRFEFDTAAMGVGKPAREECNGFKRLYFYDALGRPSSTIQTHGYHSFGVSRAYNQYGRAALLTYPTGFSVSQVYTENGHLSEVRNAANSSQVYWRVLEVNVRNQVERETLGNGIKTARTFDSDTGLIKQIESGTSVGTANIQDLDYSFDLIGNLTQRRDKRFGSAFQEDFSYDSLNRLRLVETTGASAVHATYDVLGNLRSRSDVGVFSYAQNGTGPHALTSVASSPRGEFDKSCSYDEKGNRIIDGTTVIEYSSFNKATQIRKGSDALYFDYSPNRARFRQTIFQVDSQGRQRQTVREYVGGIYERETTNEGLVRHIHYISGGNGVVAIHTDERCATTVNQRTRYIHKDHLGSIDVITDNSGAVVERLSFDAWGRKRDVSFDGAGNWLITYPAPPAAGGTEETHRGFTGHEMLGAVGLVHMGGRLYDPLTGRFLSPDPFVQAPNNLQSINRYSYVLNNPLSYTDPSGFFFKKIARFFKKHARTIAAVAIGAFTGFVAAPALFGTSGTLAAIAKGAGFGFGSAFSGTLLAGGSFGDALRAGLFAGVVGGVSGGVADLVGTEFAKGGAFEGIAEFERMAHGVTQGAIRQASGGKFIHGYLSGSLSPQFSGGSTIRAAIAGGTVEAIGGGKFANGALSGAIRASIGESSYSSEFSDATPVDTSLNDLTISVGIVVNLPIAIPVWIAAQVSDSVMGWVHDYANAVGTGDKFAFGIVGNSLKGQGRPGLLGTAASITLRQGFWGDGVVFRNGQELGHDPSIPGNSRWFISAPETLLQIPGIGLKNLGFGPVRRFLPGENVPILRGLHNGLTPNLSSYPDRGYNHNLR